SSVQGLASAQSASTVQAANGRPRAKTRTSRTRIFIVRSSSLSTEPLSHPLPLTRAIQWMGHAVQSGLHLFFLFESRCRGRQHAPDAVGSVHLRNALVARRAPRSDRLTALHPADEVRVGDECATHGDELETLAERRIKIVE